MIAYCPTCREHFHVDRNPPYAVMHLEENDVPVHTHPLTGEVLFQLREESDEVSTNGP